MLGKGLVREVIVTMHENGSTLNDDLVREVIYSCSLELSKYGVLKKNFEVGEIIKILSCTKY